MNTTISQLLHSLPESAPSHNLRKAVLKKIWRRNALPSLVGLGVSCVLVLAFLVRIVAHIEAEEGYVLKSLREDWIFSIEYLRDMFALIRLMLPTTHMVMMLVAFLFGALYTHALISLRKSTYGYLLNGKGVK